MEKITIEFITESYGLCSTGWRVQYGEKYADGLGYDEMLGLVAGITMPESRPCLQWLKSEEEHQAWRDRMKASNVKSHHEP